jgi:DNA segregation ATPase FtsK/SpoIIIE, S-DNA-T family
MWELFAIPLVSSAAALYVGTRKNDRNKTTMDKIFKNMKIGGMEGNDFVYPKLIKKEQHKNYDRYTYRVPIGLSEKTIESLQEIISATLDAPIEITFKKHLIVDVYHHEIPELVPYAEVPNKKGWVVPLGVNEKGWHFHDFDKTPHCIISGTTRFGKTVMLKNIMTYLIEHHADDVEILILDMKGGLEFGRYRNLKQVIDVASEAVEAHKALQKIQQYMAQKMLEFHENKWSNIVNTPIQKRLFIIVDEAAQLTPENHMQKALKNTLSACQHILGEVARIGGALGVRLIFCTQYPTSDTLPRQIKQNADLKISFRLPAGYASQVAIDDYGAEKLPSDIKGRAIIKTHEMMTVQTPFISDDEMWKRLGGYEVDKSEATEQRKEENERGEDFVRFE